MPMRGILGLQLLLLEADIGGGPYNGFFNGEGNVSGSLATLDEDITLTAQSAYSLTTLIAIIVFVVALILLFISKYIFGITGPISSMQRKSELQRLLIIIIVGVGIFLFFRAAVKIGHEFNSAFYQRP